MARKLLFLLYIVIGQWPVWAVIWLLGIFHFWKVLFVIYPVNSSEYNKLSFDWPILRRLLSGRPLPAGIFLQPAGIYFFVSNRLESLAKVKNRPIAKKIEKRMRAARRLARAEVVGFAGGLGYVLEKRHKIRMIHPFYDSSQGNVFCLCLYISRYAPRGTIAIIGGGQLGSHLQSAIGRRAQIFRVRRLRRQGKYVLTCNMPQCDCIVNLLPSGNDFVNLGIDAGQHPVIIDFSRPPIPSDAGYNVVAANKLQNPDLRFFPPLPGGWQTDEIPACSLPSLLAAQGDLSIAKNQYDFNIIAQYMRFNAGGEDA